MPTPPHPMIEAIAGNVLMESGEYPAAVARFESALTRYPNKMQLIHDYPEALIKAGRPADASAFAERELVTVEGVANGTELHLRLTLLWRNEYGIWKIVFPWISPFIGL